MSLVAHIQSLASPSFRLKLKAGAQPEHRIQSHDFFWAGEDF
jgi:hypothetical protein